MGNSLGTRLVCSVCGTEMLVTRPGDGKLQCCGVPMEAKGRPPAQASKLKEAEG
jgi:hypothetical protein